MLLLTCHAFFLPWRPIAQIHVLPWKIHHRALGRYPGDISCKLESQGQTKAAINQKCLKHSIFQLENLTHLLCFPQDKGYLAYLFTQRERTPATQMYLISTCSINHWLWSIDPLFLTIAQRQACLLHGASGSYRRAQEILYFHCPTLPKIMQLSFHIWGNHRGQHIQSTMGKPCPGKTTPMVTLSPAWEV